jgi:hypothetical protein
VRYVFISENGVIVNTIVGLLTDDQLDLFLRDYRVLFGAARVIKVADDSIAIYSGGTYNESEGFLPPPPPPVPEIVEGTSEELAPLVEEIANGDAPIE